MFYLYLAIGLVLAGIIVNVTVAVWARASFVSLNQDIRLMLDGQHELRARLDRLEMVVLPDAHARPISLQ